MDKVIDGVDVSGCEFIGDIKNKLVKCTSWVHNSKKQVSGHWDCRENKNCYYKQLKRLQAEYDDLHLNYAGCKTANNGLQELNEKLQAELQRYKDMEQKGLEEFKDVGGCWGCGLQLQLNQDIQDIKQLKEENEKLKDLLTDRKRECKRLKEEKGGMQILIDNYIALTEKYHQALQEIREMATLFHSVNENKDLDRFKNNILAKINEVIGAEE